MNKLSDEELLQEIENIIQTMPNKDQLRQNNMENFIWYGRASSLIDKWSQVKAVCFQGHIDDLNSGKLALTTAGYRKIVSMLHEAKLDLQMCVRGPLTKVINQGETFIYFDEIRKILQEAKLSVFFVDPYMDADFVSKYITQVSNGAIVKLLTSDNKLNSLKPALITYSLQEGTSIELRVSKGLHDRYLFIDDTECYQSGASFKDGAKNSATSLTQIVDAFKAMFGTYEQKWNEATLIDL